MHLAIVSVHVGEMFAEGPRAYRVSLGFSPEPVDLQGEGAQFGEVLELKGGSSRVEVAAALRAMAGELELLSALAETKADIAAGRFVVETPAQHVARVLAMIEAEATEPRCTKDTSPGKAG